MTKHKARAANVACPDADMPPAPGAGARYGTATRCLINVARAASGLRALRSEPRLAAAAGVCANDMVNRGYFDHVSPEGSTPRMRVRAAGYRGRTGRFRAAETIGWGSGEMATPAAIVSGWLHSPEHRAILLAPLYREVGIGLAIGAPGTGEVGATVAADFGSRR